MKTRQKQKMTLLLAILFGLSLQWHSAWAQSGSEFTGGDGTEGNPWQISTAGQLAALNNYVGYTLADKHFILTADIDLTEYLSPGNPGNNDGKGWDPIGDFDNKSDSETAFYGSLDGQGFTVSGLWIDRVEEDFIGLFGYTQNATLENMRIEIADEGVKGNLYVGGLVGEAMYTTITGCSVSGGMVCGYARTGGLAGYLLESSANACFASVDIRLLEIEGEDDGSYRTAYSGGLAGLVDSNSSLTDCYATGSVSLANEEGNYNKQDIRLGGLAGFLTNNSEITRCYATGEVTASKGYPGGLAGENYNSTITSSYFNSDTNDVLNGVGNVSSDGVEGKSVVDLRKKATFEDWTFDSTLWTIQEGTTAPYFNWQTENYPLHVFAGGDGTEGNPWQISTAGQLAALNNYLGRDHEDKHFKIVQDIDLTDWLTADRGNEENTKGWKPIGKSTDYFWGSLDGQGFTVSGLWIDRVEENFIGLFGYTENATLENIHIEIADEGVKGYDYAGGLVGSAAYTTITGCSVSGGMVCGYDLTGGLAGYLFQSSANACFASVDIRLLEMEGEYDGFTWSTRTGGLAGRVTVNSSLTDCYATGSVSLANEEGNYNKQSINIGGLVGYLTDNSEITRCYATGEVTASKGTIGGLIGYSSGTITSSYFNSDANDMLNGVGDGSNNGVEGKSVVDLRKKATFEDWTFDSNLWTIREGTTAPYFSWQTDNFPLLFNDPSAYHTLTLTVAPGIDLYNLAAGTHQIEDGSHLHLQFLPEDLSLTADDILFLVDGVETSFKVFDEGHYYSYILNPVMRDHTVLIALRQYTVTLPETDGAVITPSPGEYLVDYGQAFTFTLGLNEFNDPEDVKVFVNGIELAPGETRQARSLQYTIESVTGPVLITVEGLNITSNTLPTQGIRLAVESGKLKVESGGQVVDVAVYTITGQLVTGRRVVDTEWISLQPGIYVVRAGEKKEKIMVND